MLPGWLREYTWGLCPGVALEADSERLSQAAASKMEALKLGWGTGASSRSDYASAAAVLARELSRAHGKKVAAIDKRDANRKMLALGLRGLLIVPWLLMGLMY